MSLASAIDSMTVKELQAELRKRSLSATGNKAELQERLRESLKLSGEDLNSSFDESRGSPKISTPTKERAVRRRKSSTGSRSNSFEDQQNQQAAARSGGEVVIEQQKPEDTPPMQVSFWDLLPMITFFIALFFALLIFPTRDEFIENTFKPFFGVPSRSTGN